MPRKLAVAEIRRRIAQLARRLGRRGALMKGSLAEVWVRCGRETCRCAQGEKHGPYLYVSVFLGAKTKSVYVPRHLEREVRQWVANARAVQADLVEITRLHVGLLRRGGKGEDGVRPGSPSRKSRKSAH